MLDHAPVLWRHRTQQALWRLAAASVRGFRRVLDAQGFTEIHTPKLVASSTESGANVFTVDYFGRPAYPAQSPQFYKQIMVGVFERVYETGPVFRAEPHDTVRHLAEYVSLDAELGFITDHRDVVTVLRDVLAGMVAEIRASANVTWVGGHTRSSASTSLPWRDTRPASGSSTPVHSPTTRTGPIPSTSSFRGLELVTGGQRLHQYADYQRALADRGEPTQSYEPYLEAFRHGMPPHGGFAIGLERWTARLVNAATSDARRCSRAIFID